VLGDDASTKSWKQLEIDSTQQQAQPNPRRVSLESPPIYTCCDQTWNSCNDDGSSASPSKTCSKKSLQPTAAVKISVRRKLDFGLCAYEDSSDWSADWDNLTIESLPLVQICAKDKNCAKDDRSEFSGGAAHSVQKFSEDESYLSGSESYHRYFKNSTKQLVPSVVVTRSSSSNPRSFSTSSGAKGRKKVSFVSYNPSLRLVLFLLYAYAMLWNARDGCDRLVLRKNTSIRKRFRPRIRFSENPSLSLIQASRMHERMTI